MRPILLRPLLLQALCLAWALLLEPAAQATPLACLIEPSKVADIGSQNIGVIDKIFVERGAEVAAGQPLVLLKNDVERAAMDVAKSRAEAEGELNGTLAARDLAQSKLTRTRDLFAQNFVSQQAVDQADAEARVAEQRVLQARENQRIAARELALSTSQLAQRKILSPFAGVVVDRYRNEGERIEREPVVRLAQVNPLRVELVLPAAYFNRLSLGDVVTVRTSLPQLAELQAKVSLVDRVMDAASATFRARLTLPNADGRIPAGLRCQVDLDGKAEAAASQPAPASLPPASAPPKAPARPATTGAMAAPLKPAAQPEPKPAGGAGRTSSQVAMADPWFFRPLPLGYR